MEKDKLIDCSKVSEGEVLVGIASSGLHSNGFSLVRKIVYDSHLDLNHKYEETGDKTLGEVLLTPTKIYVKPVLEILKSYDVHGIAHITGGGFDENIPRILPENCSVEIRKGSWEIPGVFKLLEKYGKIPPREMFNIFNMGIGMVLAVNANDVGDVIKILTEWGENASVIGKVIPGDKTVVLK